jgi:transposase
MTQQLYLDLVAENQRLRDEVAALGIENAALRGENASLRKRLDDLQAALEAAERKSKRQAAPFSKGEPKRQPRKPGRKPGKDYGKKAHRTPPPPEVIDEHYDVPLPDCCTHCGSRNLEETHVATQYQTEIPRRPIHRQFDIHIGMCCGCGRSVHGRHELQTSDAVGAAAAQLGPAAHAAMAVLNKELGLSHGKIRRCFEVLFGIPVARATSAHSVARSGRRCEGAYQEIRAATRASPWVVPDETGWRVGGQSAWLHVFVTELATCYEIDPGRGHDVAQRLLGLDWSGTMIHDGWSPYDMFTEARHQQCLRHLQNRCQRMLETAVGGAVRLPRAVLELVDFALAVRRDYRAGLLTDDQMACEYLGLGCLLEELAEGRFTYGPNQRLAKHLMRHRREWFWFLLDPTIDATNWRGEQGVRPGVVNRKVWGGNRTWPGARPQSILMSVFRTCAQLGRDGLDYLIQTLCSPHSIPLLGSGR